MEVQKIRHEPTGTSDFLSPVRSAIISIIRDIPNGYTENVAAATKRVIKEAVGNDVL